MQMVSLAGKKELKQTRREGGAKPIIKRQRGQGRKKAGIFR